MISQNELDMIFKGHWMVDCPTMSLIPACTDTESYQGTGYIEQGEDYKLRFKLISSQRTGFSFKPEPTQAGQLYAPEEYWKLVARDVHGREWTSPGILPEILHDEGTVATGNLRNLNSSELNEQEDKHPTIKLWFLGDFEVTCNQTEMTTTTVGGEQVGLSGEWNRGKFTLGQREFFLRREKDWLFLETVSSSGSFQPFYADRIEESLEFVLGRPTRATVLLENERHRCSLQIRSVAPSPYDASAKPPYPSPVKEKEGYFWRLFGLHLRYIEKHDLPSRSPLARAWQYFIDSRNSAVEVRALALGVGVEALLKVCYSMPEVAVSPQLEAASNLISESELDESVKKRLLDSIAMMRQTSPSDRLHQLLERGVIKREHFKAWKWIRNRAAHAGKFSVDDATMRNCNLVLTAAHRIVFDVLGYEGAYKDYGTISWPMLSYPETLLRESEMKPANEGSVAGP